MIITRKQQVLLNLLALRVVIDQQFIYPLPRRESLYIPLHRPAFSLVVTNGFHITPAYPFSLHPGKVCRLTIGCRIDNEHILSGILCTLLLYIIAFYGGWVLAKCLSLVPLLYGLFLFYGKRKQFLKVYVAAERAAAPHL